MPRILRACTFDERFEHRRDAFLQVLRANLAEAMKDAPAFRDWLQNAHAPAKVWKKRGEDQAWADRMLAGQPHVEGKPGAVPPKTKRRFTDLSKTERQLLTLDSAASEVCTHARGRGENALFGPSLTKKTNRLHAIRVALLAGIVIDPEAAEHLAKASPLADLPWEAGRVRICKVYGEELLGLTATAFKVLDWAPAPDDLGHPPRPAEIKIAIDRFAKLLTRSQSLGDALTAWHERAQHKRTKLKKTQLPEGPSELPDDVHTHRDLELHKRARAKEPGNEASPWRSLWDTRDNLTFSVRQWRLALDSACSVVAGTSKWMDNLQADPLSRWSAQVMKELRAFGGLVHRDRVGDTPLALQPEELAPYIASIRKWLSELGSISGTLQSAIGFRDKRKHPKGDATGIAIGNSGPKGPPGKATYRRPLSRAAREWFGCVKPTLATMIVKGTVKAKRETRNLWVFDCDEVDGYGFAEHPSMFDPSCAVQKETRSPPKKR